MKPTPVSPGPALTGGLRAGAGVGPPCEPPPVADRSIGATSRAVRGAWSRETCDPADVASWSPDNPARGQCGPTALVVHDLHGGELVLAEVHWPDGSPQGFHYWNVLPDGRHLDLTADQFRDGEVVGPGRRVVRPQAVPRRCASQYLLLRQRVLAAVSLEQQVERRGRPGQHHGVDVG